MEIVTVVGSLILGVLLLFLFIIPTFTKSSQSKTAHSNQTTKSAVKGPQKYTATEVSLHNKRTDCWVIIKDKVYDVTSYVEEHPGGDAILTNAGGDSTEGFFGQPNSFWEQGFVVIGGQIMVNVTNLLVVDIRYAAIINKSPLFWRPQHGTRVFDIIDDFCIGELKE